MIGYAPDYLCKKIVKRCDISLRSTKNFKLLNIPLYRTAAGQRSLHYRFVSTWNNLKPKLKLSKSTKKIKHLLKKDILFLLVFPRGNTNKVCMYVCMYVYMYLDIVVFEWIVSLKRQAFAQNPEVHTIYRLILVERPMKDGMQIKMQATVSIHL